ncbi:hypothetical protein DSO57_1017118 [Entomophthora muscae]|uniref:Uncharacterized protein n=1 Tax=Entomophthora muscae TaxID=34485 RepID=A0ACC2UDL1_9FUNG|nr:hypothetical protein DSO57_1017118 [Entomophthora muscae]
MTSLPNHTEFTLVQGTWTRIGNPNNKYFMPDTKPSTFEYANFGTTCKDGSITIVLKKIIPTEKSMLCPVATEGFQISTAPPAQV